MKFSTVLASTFIFFYSCNPPVTPSSCNEEKPVNAGVPPPHIQSIKVNGQPKDSSSVFLSGTEEDLLIELDRADVDLYAFRLNNSKLDPCGIMVPHPYVRFTFLPGGAYTLEYWTIKGGFTSRRQTLQFYVKEALVERWWFYPSLTIYLFLIIGAIVYFWTLYNIRQKLKLQYIRNQIASDLHDEVSSDISSIGISMAILERRIPKGAEDVLPTLQEIKQTLEETKSNLSDTVWAINPQKDNSSELFERMRKFAYTMLNTETTKLKYTDHLPKGKSFRINMSQRFNALMIFKEAVHNIHRHAQASLVEINLQPHPDGVCIEIKDNGKGFDLESERDGNGINNFFKRSKENFIDFHLESAPGKGVFVRIVIPEI